MQNIVSKIKLLALVPLAIFMAEAQTASAASAKFCKHPNGQVCAELYGSEDEIINIYNGTVGASKTRPYYAGIRQKQKVTIGLKFYFVKTINGGSLGIAFSGGSYYGKSVTGDVQKMKCDRGSAKFFKNTPVGSGWCYRCVMADGDKGTLIIRSSNPKKSDWGKQGSGLWPGHLF